MRLFNLNRSIRRATGMTLVEIMVVTVVIALMAALSFPSFKIIQQRGKERRLRKILYEVRDAISGSKSALSLRSFQEGYRTRVRLHGVAAIEASGHTDDEKANLKAKFLQDLNTKAMGYPSRPADLWRPDSIVATHTVVCADGTTYEIPSWPIGQRFLRGVPQNPFKGWAPAAEFVFYTYNGTEPYPATKDANGWADGVIATGVVDIRSRYAGMALDGSNTDDW